MFYLKVIFYKTIMKILKIAGNIINIPKPILFVGIDSSLELCSTISQRGHKKILLVTDSMLIELGVIDEIKAKLTECGVDFFIYDGIQPDPTFDQIEEGYRLLKENNCDAVLVVGGGSPIDASKVISALPTNPVPIKKMTGWFKLKNPPLPFYAIPTTAGTGSEVTIVAVVSDPITSQKFPIIDPKLVPQMAALDGKLMTGIPPAITAGTGMDALTHAIESYISKNASRETDQDGLSAAKLIVKNLPKVYSNGEDLDARENMALASCFAGMAFTKANVGYVHALAHQFGAFYHTPHGLANAIALPYILDYSKDACIERLAQLAKACELKVENKNPSEQAQIFINHIKDMNRLMNIPIHLAELKKEDISGIAKNALKEAHYNFPVPKYMNQKTCEKILQKMLA